MDGGRGGYGGMDGGRGGYGGMDGGRGGYGGMDGGRGGYGGMDGGRGGYGGEFGRGGGFSVEMLGGGSGSIDPMQFEMYTWDGTTRNLLFRYFDSDVEPGKQYRYRVRLALVDVNAFTPAMYLSDEANARRAKEVNAKGDPLGYRYSDWSEPSRTATVPLAGLVYIAGAEPANPLNFASEPQAKLLIKSLDAKLPAETALAEMFLRGTVLNLFQKQAQIIWSASFQTTDRDGAPQDSPKFNFRTGLTLLDFDGGEVLGGNRELTAPARALNKDSAGKMMLESELDEYETVWQYNKLMEMKEQAERQQRERERDGDRGGRGGRGGYGGGGRDG
jgi:hypothetical protein